MFRSLKLWGSSLCAGVRRRKIRGISIVEAVILIVTTAILACFVLKIFKAELPSFINTIFSTLKNLFVSEAGG